MIPKLTTGNGFGGCLRYDTRQGLKMKSGLAKVLDVSGVEFRIDKDGNYIIDTKRVSRDFRAQTMGYQGSRDIRKPVYHWVLSYHPDDNVSEEQMIEDAQEFLKRIGFDDTQYVMTVHYDKAHHHLHIVTNIVNNQGKRIPTMGLIDKAHAAAAAITKERGYTWGETAQKKAVTKEKVHDPHDRARKVIEPIIQEAKAEATSLDEFKEMLETHGISCKITLAQDGKRGGISYAYEYEGMVHPFKGSSIGRELSFSYVNKAIDANCKRESEKAQEKYHDIRAGYSSVIPQVAKELVSIRNNCYQLYKDTSDARIAIKAETTEKYNELRSLWKQFNELNETRRNEKDTVKVTEAIGGMLMLLNPIVGVSVILLAKISGDVRESSQRELKKQLLLKIESARNEISELAEKKAKLDIKKSECLNAYLYAKQYYQEYMDGLKTVEKEILDMKSESPKIKFDFVAAQNQRQPEVKTASRVPDTLKFDLYNMMMEASGKHSLDIKLLTNKAVIEPVLDRYGGVSDFRITLAQEGCEVKANDVIPPDKIINLFDKWESWTHQVPAYKLLTERVRKRDMEDICRTLDKLLPEGSPRIPKDICYRIHRNVQSITYVNCKGESITLKVEHDNYIRFNDGSAVDLTNEKYYAPKPKPIEEIEQQYTQSQSQNNTSYGIRLTIK